MSRRIYPLQISVNGKQLSSVVIDPHYEQKHRDSVTDEVILELVKQLDGRFFRPVDEDDEGFQYYINDRLEVGQKFYKLVCCFMKMSCMWV